MNDADFPVAKVLDGIDVAAAAGLKPLKINMVVKRGTNESSIVPMARHFKGTGHIVRFIEFMDVGATNGWRMDDVVPAREVVRTIDAELPLRSHRTMPRSRRALALQGRQRRNRRHRRRRRRSAAIARVRACPPTASSTRACSRPTATTSVRSCAAASPTLKISDAIAAVWKGRTDQYSEIRTANTVRSPKVEMSYIGG